ncbi:MAG: YqiA/YcfP family alpha/beta fold hydrolase [Burkholderiales bacterium]
MTARIVYLHGFNSSPQSFKARLVADAMAAGGHAADYVCPALPPQPAAAIALAAAAIEVLGATALIGSSLGGYYATHLAERLGLTAVLVNPAVRPYELLAGHIGPQKNFHTGAAYELTRADVDALRALEVAVTRPERYFLMVTTGDEVLDYRQAVALYRGAPQLVIEGGDHAFREFGAHLPAVFDFCGFPA